MAKLITRGLDVTRLDSLVADLGVRVRLWKSTLCPNMASIESLDHDPNCPVCNSNMLDFDCVETTMMFQQQHLTEQFKVQGTFNLDEVLVTFRVGVVAMNMAKVEVLDFVEDFYELIQRQAVNKVDALKYPACSVDAVFVIRNSVQVRFHHGTDFELDQNGSIKWVGNHRPLEQEVYSVYYKYHPVYRLVKAVHRDRFTQFNSIKDLNLANIPESSYKTVEGRTYVKAPETWVLKRDFLLDRKDKTQDVPALLPQNQFFDPNDPVDDNGDAEHGDV